MEGPRTTDCSVCEEHYDADEHVPRILSCGHTYCHQCVLHLVSEKPDSFVIHCPLCRALHQLPMTTDVQRRLDSVPRNIAAMHMAEELRAAVPVVDASVPTNARECSVHNNRPLEFWCSDCSTLRCSVCVSMTKCRQHKQPLLVGDDRAMLTLLSQHMSMAQSAMDALRAETQRYEDLRLSLLAMHAANIAEIDAAHAHMSELLAAQCARARAKCFELRDSASKTLHDDKEAAKERIAPVFSALGEHMRTVNEAIDAKAYQQGLQHLATLAEHTKTVRALAADPTLKPRQPASISVGVSQLNALCDAYDLLVSEQPAGSDRAASADTALVRSMAGIALIAPQCMFVQQTGYPRRMASLMRSASFAYAFCAESDGHSLYTVGLYGTYNAAYHELDGVLGIRSPATGTDLIAPGVSYFTNGQELRTPSGRTVDVRSFGMRHIHGCATCNHYEQEHVWVLYSQMVGTRRLLCLLNGVPVTEPMVPPDLHYIRVASDGRSMFAATFDQIITYTPKRLDSGLRVLPLVGQTGPYKITGLVGNRAGYLVIAMDNCLAVKMPTHNADRIDYDLINTLPKQRLNRTDFELALTPNSDLLMVVYRIGQLDCYKLEPNAV